MIDLHTHILPGIDDGAQDEQQSKEMAEHAAKLEDIHTVIATPHHLTGRFDNPAHMIEEAVDNLNIMLEKEAIPIKALPGQEVRLNRRFFNEWEAGTILTLNHSKYILVEFETKVTIAEMKEWIHELKVLGLVPIIAHPERIAAVHADPSALRPLVEGGAFCQATALTIAGRFGRKTQKTAEKLCRDRLIHFLASDAHDTAQRSFQLIAAYDKLRHWAGDEWCQYVMHNAEKVISNADVEVFDYSVSEKKKWYRIFSK